MTDIAALTDQLWSKLLETTITGKQYAQRGEPDTGKWGEAKALRDQIKAAAVPAPVPDPEPVPPTGTLLAKIDYEGGNTGQWSWGVQDKATVADTAETKRGTLRATQEKVGDGSWAARIDLPANTSGNRAAEGLRKRSIDIGKTDWFGIMFLFPSSGWKDPQGWGEAVIWQLNYMSMHSPAFAFGATLSEVRCTMLGGKVTDSPLSYEYNNGPSGSQPPQKAIPADRFALDVWHECIVGVKWATGWTGWVECHHRRKGESAWVKTVDVRNVPTQQWGQTDGKNVTAAGIDVNTGQPYVTCDKAGCYAGAGANPLVLYHDKFVVGTTKEIVAAQLP